jgi:hypothetical protein
MKSGIGEEFSSVAQEEAAEELNPQFRRLWDVENTLRFRSLWCMPVVTVGGA